MIQSLLGLFRLGLSTRFRVGGAYWSWREETAFGSDRSTWPTARARRHAMFEYARWAWRMRRFTR
ncbi:MAG: hypothetical protein DWH97_08375 [Planctomycetota bacterium]|nr:MAG: hypothetical protein DWH97_08375 [Planctomycetota bacterium]RLS96702.1 MAG: hypothetical protein DWI12_01335 [Planctomycetota bacterium]